MGKRDVGKLFVSECLFNEIFFAMIAVLLQLIITNAYGSGKDPDPDAPGNVGGGLGGSSFSGSFGGSFGGAIGIGSSFVLSDPCASGCQEVRVTGYRQPPPTTGFYLPQNVIWANVGSIQIAQPNFVAAAPVKNQRQQKQECEGAGKKWVGADAALGLSMLSQYSGGLSHIAQIPQGGVGSGFCREPVNDNLCRVVNVAAATFIGKTSNKCNTAAKATACVLVTAAAEAFACDVDYFGRSLTHRGINVGM